VIRCVLSHASRRIVVDGLGRIAKGQGIVDTHAAISLVNPIDRIGEGTIRPSETIVDLLATTRLASHRDLSWIGWINGGTHATMTTTTIVGNDLALDSTSIWSLTNRW